MTNRSKLISLIKAVDSKELNSEIEYYMEVGHEGLFDTTDAFDDAYTFAEENNERRLLKICRGILIKVGFFIEEPEKNDVGRDTRFTYNGKKYNCVAHWDGWINE